MPTPAPFPSVLATSGQNLVDANGYVLPQMRGFNVQPAGWASSNYAAMSTEAGAPGLIRTVVFWDQLESPSQGNISSTYIAKLDTHIANCVANNFYTVINFYFGPGGGHSPTWVTDPNDPTHAPSSSTMSAYLAWGQFATQYLAKRYGDPTNPLGAPDAAYASAGQGKYTPAVIGFGLNEITPDDQTVNSWATTLFSQQITMLNWFRVNAPPWIGVISPGFGASAIYANAPGSGHTATSNHQTFTTPSATAFAAATPSPGAGANVVMEIHDYFKALTTGIAGFDGRDALGKVGSTIIKGNVQTTYTTYPPVVSGTTIPRSTCQSEATAYIAPHVAYCAPGYANCPLLINEFGFAPVGSGGTPTFTGGDLWAADHLAVWSNANAAGLVEWDYNTSNTNDPYAARPGAGAAGADPNGWLTVTNLAFAAVSSSGSASRTVTVTASASGTVGTSSGAAVTVTASPAASAGARAGAPLAVTAGTSAAGTGATASGTSLAVTAAPAAGGNASTGGITQPGTPYVVGHVVSASGTAVTVPVTTALTAGDTLVLCWGTGGSADKVNTVSDTQSNAYTIDNAVSAGTGRTCGFCYVVAAAGLSLTDTISLTFSTTSASRVTAIGIHGVTAPDLAPAGTQSAGSTTPSASTGTLSQQYEICVGVMATAGGSAPTGLSWTLVETQGTSGTILTTTYTLPGAATASQANSGTLAVSNAWGDAVITFQGVTAGAVTALAEQDITVATAAAGTVTGTTARPVTIATSAAGSITVANAVTGTAALAVTAAVSASGPIGTYSATYAAAYPGGPVSSPAPARIAGTPTAAGTYTFTAQITDHAGTTASRTLTLVINPVQVTITITGTVPGQMIAGTAYTAQLAAQGGTGPYTFTITSGQLPPGLTLTSGLISGTPTTTGTYTFTVTAADSLTSTGSAVFTIVVSPVPVPPPVTTAAWHFLIAASQPDGTYLAEITQAQTRTFTVRAGAGTYSEASADINGTDPAYVPVAELTTDIQVLLGADVLFCGRIGALQDNLDASSHRTTPNALDYREILRRRALVHGGPNFNATATDVADIAWGLIRPDVIPGEPNGYHGVQNYAGGNLGIVRGQGSSGLGITAQINYTQQQFAGLAIDNLSAFNPGIDWDITPYGQADLRLDMWAPLRGTDRGVVLYWPSGDGPVSSIQRSTDPSQYANSVFVTAANLSNQLREAPDLATRPEGRWDQVIGTTHTVQGSLNAAADWYLTDYEAVLPAYQIAFKPGAWDGPSHIWLGDTVRLMFKSGRLAVNDAMPVTEMSFTVDSNGVETLVMTVGRLPFHIHRAVPSWLRRLRRLETE